MQRSGVQDDFLRTAHESRRPHLFGAGLPLDTQAPGPTWAQVGGEPASVHVQVPGPVAARAGAADSAAQGSQRPGVRGGAAFQGGPVQPDWRHAAQHGHVRAVKHMPVPAQVNQPTSGWGAGVSREAGGRRYARVNSAAPSSRAVSVS